jgi:hypothetical protein
MRSHTLWVLTSKRAEVVECIKLLEGRPQGRGSLAIMKLVERLRAKVDWLDGRIELERQHSNSFGETSLSAGLRSVSAA